jgi:hypothetical protein
VRRRLKVDPVPLLFETPFSILVRFIRENTFGCAMRVIATISVKAGIRQFLQLLLLGWNGITAEKDVKV